MDLEEFKTNINQFKIHLEILDKLADVKRSITWVDRLFNVEFESYILYTRRDIPDPFIKRWYSKFNEKIEPLLGYKKGNIKILNTDINDEYLNYLFRIFECKVEDEPLDPESDEKKQKYFQSQIDLAYCEMAYQ